MTVGYRQGRGAPLVLIHGGGGTWAQWKPAIPPLEAQHDVLAVNLVGHLGGEPVADGTEASVDLLAAGVEHDMNAAGWERAHLAGTSLGAWVALELARRDKAITCTALAPAGGWRRGDLGLRAVAGGYRLAYRLAALLARQPGRWVRRPGLRRLLLWHHLARPERMPPADASALLVGLARCRSLPAIVAWAGANDGAAGLDRIGCPVQLLFPERDLVLPRRRYGERLVAALPHAEAHDIPGAGHLATYDDPGAVARHILSFTARAGGA